MQMRFLIAAAGLAAFVTPSLAAEYYIVQDTTTKRCSIVEQRPTTTTTHIVGPGTAYTTRTEAEGAMKTVKVCESGGTVGGPAASAPCTASGALTQGTDKAKLKKPRHVRAFFYSRRQLFANAAIAASPAVCAAKSRYRAKKYITSYRLP